MLRTVDLDTINAYEKYVISSTVRTTSRESFYQTDDVTLIGYEGLPTHIIPERYWVAVCGRRNHSDDLLSLIVTDDLADLMGPSNPFLARLDQHRSSLDQGVIKKRVLTLAEMFEEHGACQNGMRHFHRLFPDGMAINVGTITEALWNRLPIGWLLLAKLRTGKYKMVNGSASDLADRLGRSLIDAALQCIANFGNWVPRSEWNALLATPTLGMELRDVRHTILGVIETYRKSGNNGEYDPKAWYSGYTMIGVATVIHALTMVATVCEDGYDLDDAASACIDAALIVVRARYNSQQATHSVMSDLLPMSRMLLDTALLLEVGTAK